MGSASIGVDTYQSDGSIFYHFDISLPSEVLIFPEAQRTKSATERIVIGKKGIVAIRTEGGRDSD